MFNFVWRLFVARFGFHVKFPAVESFWGVLCAEIGPSQMQVVQNICKSVFLKLLVARFSFYTKFPAQWWCRKLLGRSVRRDRAFTEASRAKHVQKRLSEASRCQIQLLREFSCTTMVSKASGALCAPRSGLHSGKSCNTFGEASF